MNILVGLTGMLLCLAMMAPAEARMVVYHWVVKGGHDVGKMRVITINGETPGPTIRAQQRDTINVTVTNMLAAKENIPIKFGGIRQIETPLCDGTAKGPISQGETCSYRFTAHQAGEYSYQSEYKMQYDAGLHGQIVVLPYQRFR